MLIRASQHFGFQIRRERDVDVRDADALVIHTEWHPYRRPDFARMREAMRHPVIFDGRNLYAPSKMEEAGFAYASVGRPAVGSS